MKYAVVLAGLCLLAGSVCRADFEPPVPIRTVSPTFPPEMRREHVDGLVMVKCVIDADGKVENATVLRATNTAFAAPALDAIEKWRFKPAKRDGKNVPVPVAIPIKFTNED